MHIFVDESGSFVAPTTSGSSVSVIAALVVPDSAVTRLREGLDRLAATWALAEVKGRDLDEAQFQAIHDLLAEHDTLAALVAIDMGLHPDAAVSRHRLEQAARMTRHFGPEHHPDLLKQVQEIATRIEKMPNQLYVESALLNVLIEHVLQLSILHYPLTNPAELGRFAWRLDAKDKQKKTDYEELWELLVSPFTQSQSLRHPMVFIKGADYSAFERFENPDLQRPPEHLRAHVRSPNGVFSTFDVKKLMTEDLVFADSETDRCLQLVDVVASCFRRGCNGRLRETGWQGLTRLLVRHPRTGQAIRFCQLVTVQPVRSIKDMPYGDVIISLEAGAGPPVPERI